MESKKSVDATEEEIYSVCEAKAMELVNPALDHLQIFLYVLLWYCNRAGVNAQFAYQKVRHQYLLDKGKEKGLTQLTGHCYNKHEAHGVLKIENKNSWCAPPELNKVKRVVRFAISHKRRGKEWDETHVLSGTQSAGLKKLLVESVFNFCDEQCGYEDHYTYGIAGLENLVENKMEIYRNSLNDTLGYRLINSDHVLKPMSCAEMWVFSNKNGFVGNARIQVNEIDAFLKSGSITKYDPIAEYFEKLPVWDGVDYITALAKHVKVPEQMQEQFNEHFRKAMIRNVGCGLGETINRYVIVLSGVKQNTGKSTFIRFLCPPKLEQYYTEAALRGGKDDYFKLSETFLYNLEELSTLSNRDINELKAFISANSSNERKPYDRDSKVRSRRTNFWASTNRDMFLVDDTGNTRWLIFQVDDLDWNYSKEIDIDKVWAQAYHFYLNGERGQLTVEEVNEQTRNNTEFEIRSLEHEYILEYFKPATADTGEFWTNYRLAEFFATATPKAFSMNQIVLGKAMKQLGFDADKKWLEGRTQRGYWLKQVGRPNYKHNFRSSDEQNYIEDTSRDEPNWLELHIFDHLFYPAGEVEVTDHHFFTHFEESDRFVKSEIVNRQPKLDS